MASPLRWSLERGGGARRRSWPLSSSSRPWSSTRTAKLSPQIDCRSPRFQRRGHDVRFLFGNLSQVGQNLSGIRRLCVQRRRRVHVCDAVLFGDVVFMVVSDEIQIPVVLSIGRVGIGQTRTHRCRGLRMINNRTSPATPVAKERLILFKSDCPVALRWDPHGAIKVASAGVKTIAVRVSLWVVIAAESNGLRCRISNHRLHAI